jgi:predicted transcriptional regulator YdeE
MEQEFTIYGFTTRTNNKFEFEKRQDGHIAKLWNQFFQENITAQIPEQDGHEIIAVYSNYETDYRGDYDYTIGIKSRSTADVTGLQKLIVQAGKYLTLQSDRGPIYSVVPTLWTKVWDMNDKEIGGPRAYSTDYEVYGDEAKDPNNSVVFLKLGYK